MDTTNITIREGRFYRTRSGQKVGPMVHDRDAKKTGYPWTDKGSTAIGRWSDEVEDGISPVFGPDAGDIIAEWSDAAPTDGALPNVGDTVELISNDSGCCYPVGHVGEVQEVCRAYGTFRLGPQMECNWVGRDDWRLVSRAPATDTDAATIQRGMEASAAAVDDPVSHPDHYTSHPSGVECLTITRWMGFNLGNAMKYIWRADMKGAAIEDLRKAAFYIADEIAKREAGVIDPASYRVEARG